MFKFFVMCKIKIIVTHKINMTIENYYYSSNYSNSRLIFFFRFFKLTYCSLPREHRHNIMVLTLWECLIHV